MRRLVRAAMLAACLAAGARPLAAQLRLTATGVGRAVQHRVDAGNGLELSSGTIYGASLTAAFGPRVEATLSGASGNLTRDSGLAENASLSAGEARVAVLPMPWLALRGGLDIHTFKTPIAVQRWTKVRVGGEARLALVGGDVTGLVRFELLPWVDVTGLDKPNRAFGVASGLRFGAGVLTGEVLYTLERYDFPEVGGVARVEQLSTLTFGVGVRFGR